MNATFITTILIPGLILSAAVVDDLRSKKIHNKLVLAAFALALFSQWLWGGGWAGLSQGLLALPAALLITLPLVLLRGLGAGDMKLLMALSPLLLWSQVLWLFFYALIWGGLLGLIRAAASGQLVQLMGRTLALATSPQGQSSNSMQTIPFSVALFFGWLSHLTFLQLGGGL